MLTPVEMFYIGYVMGAATVAVAVLMATRPVSRKRRRKEGE